jgi:DNA-binding beta-propeller fold protein YncE
VIDTATMHGATTLTDRSGVEPYGVALSPNGVLRRVRLPLGHGQVLRRPRRCSACSSSTSTCDLNDIPPPFTIADVDANRDGIADLGEPRGFTIRADSSRIYVTHNRSPYVSVLDVTLDANGLPTAAPTTLGARSTSTTTPSTRSTTRTPVQTCKSQGKPRFLEDIALSPDGTRALVPAPPAQRQPRREHDVRPGAGAFANRVYPALT